MLSVLLLKNGLRRSEKTHHMRKPRQGRGNSGVQKRLQKDRSGLDALSA
jgi:hypothetical protein